MRGSGRAAMALMVHIGGLVACAGLVPALAGVTALVARSDLVGGGVLGVGTLCVAIVLIAGLLLWRIPTEPLGVRVDGKEHPKLAKAVGEVTRHLDIPAPTQLRMTLQRHVELREATRFFGMGIKARYLEIGLPLVAALTVDELKAALGSELARHDAGGPLRRAGHRVRRTLERLCEERDPGPLLWILERYAGMYRALIGAQPQARADEELSGDAALATLVGKRTVYSSIRKTAAVEAGWLVFRAEYLSLAALVARAPDVLLGFHAFWSDVQRRAEIAELSEPDLSKPASGRARVCPVEARLELLKKLPNSKADTESTEDDRHAWALLRSPRNSVPEIEDKLLVAGLGDRLSWQELIPEAAAERARLAAGQLASAMKESTVEVDCTLGGFLTALHRGHRTELAEAVLEYSEQGTGLSERDLETMSDQELDSAVEKAVVGRLVDILGAAVAYFLLRAGRAGYELNWAGAPMLRLVNGQVLNLDYLLRPALEDPRLVPGLHRALTQLGVSVQHPLPSGR